VACQEWNDLHILPTQQVGTYQTMPGLDANYWNLIQFPGARREGSVLVAHAQRRVHALRVTRAASRPARRPRDRAVPERHRRRESRGVHRLQDVRDGVPLDIPRYSATTDKMAKCTLCVDRVQVGLEPACVKSCPTGCLHFGDKTDMVALGSSRVAQLKQNGFAQAALYDPPGVGGTTVITVLAHGDHPEWYGLPKDPQVPAAVRSGRACCGRWVLSPLPPRSSR